MWRWFTYNDDDDDDDAEKDDAENNSPALAAPSHSRSQEQENKASLRRGGDRSRYYVAATLDDLDPEVTAAILAQVLLFYEVGN